MAFEIDNNVSEADALNSRVADLEERLRLITDVALQRYVSITILSKNLERAVAENNELSEKLSALESFAMPTEIPGTALEPNEADDPVSPRS